MLFLSQIDPAKIAEEVVKNIPEPITPAQTYVFGLLVLSGYIFAFGVAWYFIKKERRHEEREAIAKEKDDQLTKEAIASMTTAANSITGFTHEAAQIRAGIEALKLAINDLQNKIQ